MKVDIQNFRGVSRAAFDLEKIVLIGGDNRAGKTSMAIAMGAALTGEAVGFIKPGAEPGKWSGEVPKNQAGILVREGAGSGACSISWDPGAVSVAWPSCEVTHIKQAPRASVFAAGLIGFEDLSAKERSTTLMDLLQAHPTEADLSAALAPHGVGEKTTAKLWQGIQAQGWDAAHKLMKEQGIKFKGLWEDKTGERYGEKKAEAWQPAEWDAELANESEDGLKAKVARTKLSLEQIIGEAAVSAANIEDARKRVAAVPEVLARVAEHKAATENIAAELERLAEDHAALPTVEGGSTFPCPHCGGPLAFERTATGPMTVVKGVASKRTSAEVKKIRDATAALDGKIGNAKGRLVAAQQALARAEHDQKFATEASEQLAAHKQGDAHATDAAREEVRIAEARLAAFDRWSQAGRLHQSVVRNQHMIDALAPGGVRKKKAQEALAQFNELLDLLIVSTGEPPARWGRVQIDDEFRVRHEQHAAVIPAESEEYQAKALLQVAFAKLDKSDAVVIDGASIMTKNGRNGLINFLSRAKIPALVTMSANVPDDIPDLPASLGASYWLANSVLTPLADAVGLAKEAAE